MGGGEFKPNGLSFMRNHDNSIFRVVLSMTAMGGTRKIEAMKALLFLFGIILCTVAFFAAALELAAHAVDPKLSVVSGFGQVLQVLAPDTLGRFLARFAWMGWEIVLRFPGWLIFGAPGFALIIFTRFRNGAALQDEYEHSLFLFDDLAKQAQAQDHHSSGDDFAPSTHDDLDIAGERYALDNIVDDIVLERDFLLDPAWSDAKAHRVKE